MISLKHKNISVIALIVSNFIPIVGVMFFGWDLFSILILFWAETAIIGFFNVFKIILFSRWLSIFYIPFFIFHFGFFMYLHLLFIVILYTDRSLLDFLLNKAPLTENNLLFFVPLILPFVFLFISHAVSFFTNYIAKEEYKNTKTHPFIAPYKRIMLMHISIMIGGFISMVVGQFAITLVLLIFLKIFVDLKLHIRQHRIVFSLT